MLQTGSVGKQSGFYLLVLLTLIAIISGAFLVKIFGTSAQKASRDSRTEAALAQAKEALIFYAASYADAHPGEVPGYLPCPDDGTSGEGTPATASSACTLKDVTALGRLPWKTLGLPDLRDGNQECLWYAVSGNFKANVNKTDLMNWDTNGLITVLTRDGTAVATGNTPSGAAAVIFAPGPAIGSQSRAAGSSVTPVCGGNYTAAGYLDSSAGTDNATLTGGANSVDTFIAGAPGNTFNDRLVFIRAKDVFDAIERRQHVDPVNPTGPRISFSGLLGEVTQRTAECIANYGTNNNKKSGDQRLPWTTDQPFSSDNYGPNKNYDDGSKTRFGHTPWNAGGSKADTGNTMTGNTLLSTTNCPGWSAIDPWWQNWKDHIYYAPSKNFAPDAKTPNDCGGKTECVTLNGSSTQYAGIVFFAGKRLSSQNRSNDANASTSAAKSDLSNYLEGANATVPSTKAGKEGKGSYQTGAETSTFNDRLYCINQDLSVIPCP